MPSRFKKIISVIFCLSTLIVTSFHPSILQAHEGHVHIGGPTEELNEKLKSKQQEINQLESKLQEIKSTKDTLGNQIKYFNNQIYLTELKISQTEEQITLVQTAINDLSAKISQLDIDVSKLSILLAERIVKTYKSSNFNNLELFLNANGFSDIFARYKYVRAVQLHDKQLIIDMEQARAAFDQQKTLKLQKQIELSKLESDLDIHKTDLSKQRQGKETLLEATRNDEKRYQELLSAARAEQAAFQAAIKEAIKNLKDGTPIEKGAQIALMGNSGAPGCSTATHLHFEITNKDGVHQNPANYLKPEWNIIWDNSPDGPFSMTGNWDWPMQNARITQGYGYTYWANTGFYNGKPHTGIDMIDDGSSTIRAPKSGTLYKGSTSCRGSAMHYVAIEHDDVITWYWHVQ